MKRERRAPKLSNIQILVSAMVFVVFGLIIVSYFRYILVAGSREPIMDFFRWIAWFGERIHSGTMSFVDFFSDSNEQVQPLALAIDFYALEAARYDFFGALVLSGAVLKGLASLALVALFFRETKRSRRFSAMAFTAVISICILLACLNLNQWELIAEPFGLTCAIRLVCFFGVFELLSKCLRRIFDYSFRMQVLTVIAISFLAAAVSLLMSGAYFVAFLGAMSVAFLWACVSGRKKLEKKHIVLALIWAAAVLGCVAVYVSYAGNAATQSVGIGAALFAYVKGFIVYLGCTIVPQSISETDLSAFYIAGTLLLIVGIETVLIYLFYGLQDKSYMPILLMAYAVVNGLIIAVARVPAYGVGGLAASRYTVESLLGIVGMLWAWGIIHSYVEMSRAAKASMWVVAILIAVCTVNCYRVEARIAPYRAAYNAGIREVILNAEAASDEELAICQSEPVYVRETSAFLDTYDLSVFAEEAQP